jgi:hypothetical protein
MTASVRVLVGRSPQHGDAADSIPGVVTVASAAPSAQL